MASLDIDPVFKRALRLLHSKSSDAEVQLRMLLDDAIKQRYGKEKTVTHYLNKKESSNKRDSPRKTSSGSGRKEDHKNTDKKHHEKLNEDDIGESSWESSGVKKKFSNNVKKANHTNQLLAISNTVSVAEKLPFTSISEMDDHEEEKDENDLALEILEDDLTCVICRSMEIGVCNQMVECVECKSLYHQECHQPPIAFTEINGSKSAWHCANCTEAINKRVTSSNSLEKHTSKLNLTELTAPQSADTLATSATKSSSSSFTTSSKSFGRISQAAAAKSVNSSSSSKSLVSATNSSKLEMPNIPIINTEKKLQFMKKKFAKHQEKKKHSK